MSFWCQSGGCSNNVNSHLRKKTVTWVRRRRVALLGGLCTLGMVANAQETQQPGLRATLDVTQRFELSDNPDLTTSGDADFSGRTVLNFGLESRTAVDHFQLNLGTEIEEFADGGSSFDATNHTGTLKYTRATDNASAGIDLQLRESDTRSSFAVEDFIEDSTVIVQETGSRQSYGAFVTGEMGRQAPFGASFRLGERGLRFSGTSDPALNDQRTREVQGQLNFRPNRTLSFTLSGSRSDFDVDDDVDGVDRLTEKLGLAADIQVNKTLRANLSISRDRVERSGAQTGVTTGNSVTAGLSQQLRNGRIGLTFSSDVTSNIDGRRSSLIFEHQRALFRNASLTYSIGATHSDTGGFDPLYGFDYSYALPTGLISASLSQSVATNSENQEQINTTFRAGYDYDITSSSSLGLDLSIFDSNSLSTGGNDVRRMTIGLSYEQAVTRDWNLLSELSHTSVSSSTSASRSSNKLFVGLRRQFSWAP